MAKTTEEKLIVQTIKEQTLLSEIFDARERAMAGKVSARYAHELQKELAHKLLAVQKKISALRKLV